MKSLFRLREREVTVLTTHCCVLSLSPKPLPLSVSSRFLLHSRNVNVRKYVPRGYATIICRRGTHGNGTVLVFLFFPCGRV